MEQRKVRCCASVDRPYASVREALHRPRLAGADAASVYVHSICDQENIAGLPSVTRVALDWGHANACAPLAVTSAEIYASPLSAGETQLEVEGHVGPDLRSDVESDRAAEASIHALLDDVIEHLRHDIDPNTGGGARDTRKTRP
jgi:hypothetical protein